MKSQLLRGFLLLLFSAGIASPQSTSKNTGEAGRVRTELLVSTRWLADHAKDTNLVLIHVGGSPGDYHAAHIPGARHLANDKLIDTHSQPPVELLPPDQIKANLEAVGIGDNSRVVFYSPDWDPIATRLFFTLDYIGHGDQAALLDGGTDQWLIEKRPTSNEDPTFEPGKLTLQLHPEVLAKLDWMKRLTSEPGADPQVVIIDSRPIKRYRSGHLRGAVPMFWETALVSADSPVLKPPAELKKLLAERGVLAGKKVVSYCEVGWQASHTYFLARYLGFPAAMYDGSYSEWSAEKQPVVRGDSPR